MFLIRRVLLIVLSLLLGLQAFAQSENNGKTEEIRPGKLRVLFIGNSYTYFNNLPRMVSELTNSERGSQRLEIEMVAVGGATLKKLWDDGKALAALKRNKWDYVVLQEQSTLGPALLVNGVLQIADPKVFYEYARLFDAEIKKVGAKTIFYLTWARQNNPDSQKVLNDAYQKIANELNATVAPVGVAWQSALEKYPQLALYQPDKSHPTAIGSYLAACVFYTTILGKSPEGLPPRIIGDQVDFAGQPIKNQGENGDSKVELVNLKSAEALVLQQIAGQTVKRYREQ